MLVSILLFVEALLTKLVGVVMTLVGNYKTEAVALATLGVSLLFASGRFDRYAILATAAMSFGLGRKFG